MSEFIPLICDIYFGRNYVEIISVWSNEGSYDFTQKIQKEFQYNIISALFFILFKQ